MRLRVSISALKLAVQTEVFHGFPHSIQANVRIMPKNYTMTASFHIPYNSSLIIASFSAM
jgi:hypothetical protein